MGTNSPGAGGNFIFYLFKLSTRIKNNSFHQRHAVSHSNVSEDIKEV